MRTYAYLVTWSEVETVPVGTYLIDYEHKDDGFHDRDSRVWTLWYEKTGEFRDGWAGRKLDRLCTPCRRQHRKAAIHKHDGPCGEAPMYLPPVAATTAAPSGGAA